MKRSIIYGVLLTIVIAFSVTILRCTSGSVFALADSGISRYSDVLTDLQSFVGYVEAEFPLSSTGNVDVVSVYESDTELYVYVYNPRQTQFVENSPLNKMQLATSFDELGAPTVYTKVVLSYCGFDNDYKFLKFRVADGVLPGHKYYISGIELLSPGASNAVEYPVGQIFSFSGGSATVKNLETITLDVTPTWWRSNVSSAGAGHQNQLSSVWFSVDNDFGNLFEVNAEWYEYRSSPMFVFADHAQYLTHEGLVGSITNDLDSSLVATYGDDIWCYNVESFYMSGLETTYPPQHVLSWIFDGSESTTVSAEEILTFLHSHENIAGLFTDVVDEGRTRGYNNVSIKASDGYSLASYDSNHNWFQRLLDFGIFAPETDGDVDISEAIHKVVASDLLGDDATVASRLFICEGDVPALRTANSASDLAGEDIYLFRFATTDYYASDFWIVPGTVMDGNLVMSNNADGYTSTQTIFKDFDVITLKFEKDGKYSLIPVVHSPQDIASDSTAPLKFEWNGSEWWKKLLAIIALIILFVLLLPILPYILKAIIWVITLPIRLISSLFKSKKGGSS